MSVSDRSERGRSTIAGILDRNLDEIVARYMAQLQSAGSRLVGGRAVRQQVVKQAYSMLDRVSAELSGRTPSVHFEGLSREVGGTRASARIHPHESLQAGTLLFESVVQVMSERHPPLDLDVGTIGDFFALVHRTVVELQAIAGVAYIEHLLDQIQTTQQDERRRIARELHDRVANEASSSVNDLELFEMHMERDPDKAWPKLDAAKSALQRTLKTLREVSAELRLQATTIPLQPALVHYLDSRRPPHMETHLTVIGDDSALPGRVNYELYLLIREALRNALIHSRARRLSARIVVDACWVDGVIEDDGVGFDLSEPLPALHTGLVSMRERAELLGGSLTVESGLDRGTRIHVRIPLSGELLAQP